MHRVSHSRIRDVREWLPGGRDELTHVLDLQIGAGPQHHPRILVDHPDMVREQDWNPNAA
jgi:hypothetical protein